MTEQRIRKRIEYLQGWKKAKSLLEDSKPHKTTKETEHSSRASQLAQEMLDRISPVIEASNTNNLRTLRLSVPKLKRYASIGDVFGSPELMQSAIIVKKLSDAGFNLRKKIYRIDVEDELVFRQPIPEFKNPGAGI